jgi:hypothetical protein
MDAKSDENEGPPTKNKKQKYLNTFKNLIL